MPRYLTRQSPPEAIAASGYEMEWKLDVGAECNRLLEHAADLESFGERCKDSKTTAIMAAETVRQLQLAADIRSIVERVAAFEELEEAP